MEEDAKRKRKKGNNSYIPIYLEEEETGDKNSKEPTS